MVLNNTAVVILLILNRAPRSGYEVKQFIDNSARFFWAASYGRIYPELKRLEEEGLVEGSDEPQGARPKTVYTLTDEGRRALGEWYEQTPEILELRDEAMLKIFFGDAFEPGTVIKHVDARKRTSQATLDELRAIESKIKTDDDDKDPYPFATLRCGIAMHESVVAWCEQVEGQLAAPTVSNGRKS